LIFNIVMGNIDFNFKGRHMGKSLKEGIS